MTGVYKSHNKANYAGLLNWLLSNAQHSLESLLNATSLSSIETDHHMDVGTCITPLWPSAESSMHTLVGAVKDIVDINAYCSVSFDHRDQLALGRLARLLGQLKGHKGLMRTGVILLADMLPVILETAAQPTEDIGAFINSCILLIVETLISFPERPEKDLNECATDLGSTTPTYRGAQASFELAQQRKQISFRVKQDHIGAVSLLKLMSKLATWFTQDFATTAVATDISASEVEKTLSKELNSSTKGNYLNTGNYQEHTAVLNW